MAATSARSDLGGRIVRVGLFGEGQPLLRAGNGSFVEVELAYRGSAPFAGEIRVNQRDRDGDRVRAVAPVVVTPDGQRRSWLAYFTPQNAHTGSTITIEVFDADGRRMPIITEDGATRDYLVSDPVLEMSPDELLIVDLTTPAKLAHVRWLDSARRRQLADYTNVRVVRGLSPRQLPSRWHGLEAVDAIVWDDADPTGLTDQQMEALVEWVRCGGRLLITGGQNWRALAASSLAAALPVTITGVIQIHEALDFRALIGEELFDDALRLDQKYAANPITRCQMSPRPDAIPIPAESLPPPPIAYRRLIGRGLLTFLGAPLSQLVPPPASARRTNDAEAPIEQDRLENDPFRTRFCDGVLARNLLALPRTQRRTQNPLSWTQEDVSLFTMVSRSVGFEEVGVAFMGFAILFAIAYFVTASFGSYYYLRRRGWVHHCWTAFAALSLVASAIGTGMVWVLRGFVTKLWQTSVVDASAGKDYGFATCLFGIKTPDHTRLSIALPVAGAPPGEGAAGGVIRPMPESSYEGLSGKFVAAEEYNAVLDGTRLIDVPLRATLKEFQGFWHGPLGGTLDARLVIARVRDKDGRFWYEFADGSFIRNNLPFDLKGVFLLETRSELADRAVLVNCHFLGDLPRSGPGSGLAAEALQSRLNYTAPTPTEPAKRKNPQRLDQWLVELRLQATSKFPLFDPTGRPAPGAATAMTATDTQLALVLLSTFDLLDQQDASSGPGLRRSHGRRLSCTHQLTHNTALLIGYSEAPPPAVLEVDRTALRPAKAHTIYRFVIPVERKTAGKNEPE